MDITKSFTFIALFFIHSITLAEQIPVEAFGKLPAATHVKLSPNGQQVAFIRNALGSTLIGVSNLSTGKTAYRLRTDNIKFKIDWFTWANNDMLLVSADYPVKRGGVKFKEARLVKVRVDGSDEIQSVYKPRGNERIPQFQNNIVDILPDEPNHILMSLTTKYPNQPGVYKIDLSKRKSRTVIQRAKLHINHWLTDQQHRVRLGYGRDDTKVFYRILDITTNKWRILWEYELFDDPDITPLGFGLDPNQLYIRANHKDRYAIFKVDLSKKDLPRELVYADPNYDIEGRLIYSGKTNDVIGVYHGEADDAKVFFDPTYAAFQKAINKALPDTYNNVASMSRDEQKYILHTSDSKSSGAYFLGNRDKNTLDFIIEDYPMLYGKTLSGKEKITYKARDEVKIEGYLTLPHGGIKKQNAAIIMPHGGPMSRDYGGFDWLSEFFASRGYTVLQPNFRGSSGYGFKFEMESIQKWGGDMQNDLADAAHWLTKNYTVDKNKICILGASYGGYAALMAAVKQQDTFRCAASFAGVSDLESLVVRSWKFTNAKVVKKQFGSNTDLLEKNSPVNFAKDINIPIMLIHGDKDRVVLVEHSRKMYNALTKYKKAVEYIELKNGNHHLEIEENRIKTLESLDRFLKQHLK